MSSGGSRARAKSRGPAAGGYFFFFQAEDGIRDLTVTGVQTCALPIFLVEEPEGRVRRHVGEHAHAEPEEDPLLDPRVDAPRAVRCPPGGADLAARERGPELGEQRALGLAVALALLGGERLDALTQRHARRPAASRALPGPRAGGPASDLARGPAAAGTALPAVP